MMMIPGVIAFHLYGPGFATIDQAYPRLVSDLLPVALSGFFLAVLLGAVFSSFNSLLNSAATLFALDMYAPARRGPVADRDLVRTAKIASVVIALFSFAVAPLLHFAEEGLWQVIRVFTGFYNIPTIAIVIVGLFTRRVPALGAKIAIIFHVTVYAMLRFVLDDVVTLHFIHQYALLFIAEVGIMLAVGYWRPRATPWTFTTRDEVDLTEWRYAKPLAATLFSCVIALYLLFSPLALAAEGPFSTTFALLMAAIAFTNVVIWSWVKRRARVVS